MVFADIRLARRLEAAEAANAAAATRRGGEAACLRVAGGCAVFVGVHSPLSHAVGLGLDGPVSEAEVDRLEAFYRARGASVTVDFCPLADAGLFDLLCRRGYRPTEFNNVLVRELDAFDEACGDPRVRLASQAETDLWARTVGQGFCEREELTEEEMEVGRLIVAMGAECYFGMAESGRPAAGAAMTIHDGLAVLFGDSTVPAFRRQGFQAALIAARLRAARAQGCLLATASTLPGSSSQIHYERAGFRVAYTKVTMFQ